MDSFLSHLVDNCHQNQKIVIILCKCGEWTALRVGIKFLTFLPLGNNILTIKLFL